MFKRFLCAVGLVAMAGLAMAQGPFPGKPVTMIVPFPPGGLADTVGRPVAEAMSKNLGQQVVVDNRGGAGGGIGMAAAAKAPADGYTILMALSSYSVLPEADVILGRSQMYSYQSLRPIARITADPTVLVVRADAPWKTVKEFVEAARKEPGKINYGSSGVYGSMHVPMAMLEKNAKVKMTHVPYTGAGPAVAALLGGQVAAISTGPSSILQHIKAGKVRALAHWGDEPLSTLPDVPSLSHEGYDVKFVQWSGIFAPARTPPDVVSALRQSAERVAKDPQVQAKVLGAGSPVAYMDAPAFKKYWDADDAVLRQAVRDIGKVE